MSTPPTLAQMVSTYVERARTLRAATDDGFVDPAACRGEATAYETVAAELTAAFLFPAPETS